MTSSVYLGSSHRKHPAHYKATGTQPSRHLGFWHQTFVNRAQVKQRCDSWRFWASCHFFFLPQVSSTHSNEQFQKNGCITPLPPHSASVKGSASSQTSTELFCLLLPGIGYWGGGVRGIFATASQLLPSDTTAWDIMIANMGT